jgi:hypothetical protein
MQLSRIGSTEIRSRTGSSPALFGIVLTILFMAIALSIDSVPLSAQDRPVPPAWMLNAPNSWMKVPIPWSPRTDQVSLPLRHERDRYFDGLIGLGFPLTPTNAGRLHLSEGSTLGVQPEIPVLRNREIVIGTFTTYRPVLTSSGKSIYTEAEFQLANVFEDATRHMNAGAELTIVLPGGTVRTDEGSILSFLIDPKQYFIQLGRTYLLILDYHSLGDFFILGKMWDVSDGTARPAFVVTSETRPEVNGLSTNQLIDFLNAKFKKP